MIALFFFVIVWEALMLCSMEIQLCGGRPDHKIIVWALWKVIYNWEAASHLKVTWIFPSPPLPALFCVTKPATFIISPVLFRIHWWNSLQATLFWMATCTITEIESLGNLTESMCIKDLIHCSALHYLGALLAWMVRYRLFSCWGLKFMPYVNNKYCFS